MKQHTLKFYYDRLKEKELIIKSEGLEAIKDQTVSYLDYRSQTMKPGSLFVCKGRGFKEIYLDEAIEKGAMAYVSEIDYHKGVPCIQVADVTKALSVLSMVYYGDPADALKLVGLVGTKGKSTTAYYVKSVIDAYLKGIGGTETAIISSIDTYDGVEKFESHLTTPESLELQKHFYNATQSNMDYLVMETSSQALKYGRVFDLLYDVSVFLNMGEDHISDIEHTSFEDYLESKLKIFSQSKIACVNLDSAYIEEILAASKAAEKVITFSTKEKADLYAYDIKKDGINTLFKVKCKAFDQPFILTMPGLFNVENALATIAIANALEIPYEYIYEGLKAARSSGRMEVYTGKDKSIIALVDYAHNKLSYEKLFESVAFEFPGYKVITLFGCPGGKAKNRREDLGVLAAKHSDFLYITEEDPGPEAVLDICEDIAGYVEPIMSNYLIYEDREKAISDCIKMAEPNSILLILAKGNETRQKRGTEYAYYKSDVVCVEEAFKEKDKGCCCQCTGC